MVIAFAQTQTATLIRLKVTFEYNENEGLIRFRGAGLDKDGLCLVMAAGFLKLATLCGCMFERAHCAR